MTINSISSFSGGIKLPSKIKSGTIDMTPAVKNSKAENNSWKDSYLEQVKAQAAKDFANGVRMGDEYKAMEKSTMTKYVSPASIYLQAFREARVEMKSSQPALSVETSVDIRA